MQIDENTPKNPESDTFFEKLTQKSGSYRPKTDPKWRHVPVPLYRGVPPPGCCLLVSQCFSDFEHEFKENNPFEAEIDNFPHSEPEEFFSGCAFLSDF